jgi:hypothetical protein
LGADAVRFSSSLSVLRLTLSVFIFAVRLGG